MTGSGRSHPGIAVTRQVRSALAVVAGFSVLINALMLTSPLYMMQIFDRVLTSERTETLLMLTLMAGVALLVLGLLDAVRGRLLAATGAWLEQQLAAVVVGIGLRSGQQSRGASPQVLRDLATVRGFYTGGAILGMLDAPWTVLFILVLALLHPWLGIMAAAAALVLLVVAWLNEAATRRPLREASAASLQGFRGFDTALRNAETAEAMGISGRLVDRWSSYAETASRQQLTAANRGADLLGAAKFIRTFVQIVILALGAYLVIERQLTPGGMIAGSIILGRALAPIEQSMGGWRSFVWARDAWRRIRALLSEDQGEAGRMLLPPPSGAVTCEDLWAVPPGRREPALAAVQIGVAAGETVAVIGPSGAGKSALCNVLVGAWRPARGRACLDGVDIRNWSPEQRAEFIGYLSQEASIFEGTVRDNIARLSEREDPDAVVEAAMLVGAHEYVASLPDAYDTWLGEGGVVLPRGLRQRICLARAFYGRPKFIVLDDPECGLDDGGEARVCNAIEAAREWGATVVVVAHRRSVLKAVDKLLLVSGGRIQAFGPRDQVLARAVPPPASAQAPNHRLGGTAEPQEVQHAL